MRVSVRRLQQGSVIAVLSLVLAAAGLPGGLYGSQKASAWGVSNQHQLVPAYFYPDWWNTGNKWYTMCDNMNATSDGSTAIMNPNSGPGSSANSDYTQVISYCHDKGQNVIGYVHTSYGARSLQDVEAEISDYYSWYNVDGIFLDEMSNDSSTQSYYATLYSYIHNLGGAYADDVVGNPGAAATTDWQLDTPVVDELVTFEGSASDYLNWTPPSWTSNYLDSDFAHLVYDAGNSSVMADVCSYSQTIKGGWLYITDDVLSNPWDTLPSYWTSETPTC